MRTYISKRPNIQRLLLVLAAAIFAGVSIRDTRAQLREVRTEEAAYEEQLSQLQENNEQLQSDIDRKDDMDLISDIARNELDLVSEGEEVFRVGEQRRGDACQEKYGEERMRRRCTCQAKVDSKKE